MKKRKICVVLVILALILSFMPVCAEWDGYVEESDDAQGELTIVDMNDYGLIMKSGGVPSMKYTKSAKYTAHWTNHQTNSTVFFSDNVPRDWSKYSSIDFSIYSEKETAGIIYLIVRTDNETASGTSYLWSKIPLDFRGWKNFSFTFGGTLGSVRAASYEKVNSLEFACAGWDTVADPESDIYIDSIKLTGGDVSNTLSFLFSREKIEQASERMKGNLAVYKDSKNIMCDGEITEMSASAYEENGELLVPVEAYEAYLGAQAETADGKTVIGETEFESVLKEEGENKTAYIPFEKAVKALGKTLVEYRDLKIMGDEAENDLDICDIVSYKLTYSYVDIESLTPDDYRRVRDKWRAKILGDDSINLEDDYVKTKLESVGSAATVMMQTMNRGAGINNLWGTEKIKETAEMTALYSNIWTMARGYGTKGTSTYKSEELKDSIKYALDYMYDNIYGEGVVTGKNLWKSTSDYNWWDWQIGSPQKLVDILMIMEDDLEPEQIKKYLAPVDKLVYQPWDYGSNIADEATIIMGSALLREDGERVFFGRKYLEDIMRFVDSGNGFHRDGSYVFHGNYAMNNAYGLNHYSQLASGIALLEGSAFEITNPMKYNMIDMTFKAFLPVLYKGNGMIYVAGREMGRGVAEQNKGLAMMNVFISMLDLAQGEEKQRIEEIIKYTAKHNTATNYYTSLEIGKIAEFERIMNDDTISGDKDYIANHIFYAMDKAVHQRGDYAFALSMSSSRIANYDSINNENTSAWYSGDGMTYIYNDDLTQYDQTYWSKVNYYRLAGTTVDTQKREQTSFAEAYTSTKDFVGGATNGKYGTAAMYLESYRNNDSTYPIHNSTLEARKSWFMFDDEVVALGTGINAEDGYEVDTIVENRKSNDVETISDPDVNKYEIKSVSASSVPQPENPPEATIDGNLGTRWSADGDVWIMFDLGEIKPVGYVGMAFMSGEARKSYFDIDVSEDGTEWKKVFTGESSGTTDNFEGYDAGGAAGRYVRITGRGNSANTWTSITEVRIFAPRADGMLKLGADTYVGREKVSVNGALTNVTEKNIAKENTSWVHLEGTGGYFFPNGETVNMRKTNVNPSFFEMWIDHGKSPQGAEYSYALLPNKSADETSKYSVNPDITVISNTKSVQAVKEKNLNMTGYVFWESGELNGVGVSTPLIVNITEDDNYITINASDPTQKLAKSEITLDRKLEFAEGDFEAKSEITVSGTSIKLNLVSAKGKTINIKLKKGGNENEKDDSVTDTDGNDDSAGGR